MDTQITKLRRNLQKYKFHGRQNLALQIEMHAPKMLRIRQTASRLINHWLPPSLEAV